MMNMKFLFFVSMAFGVTADPTLYSKDGCYSSQEFDPSIGSWVQTANGVKDSHVNSSVIHLGFYNKCKHGWDDIHDTPQPYWKWEAEDCHLENMDKEKFCRVMNGRKGLLLVGDSLTRLMTTTIASMIGATLTLVEKEGDLWEACDGKTMMRFIRNDYLDTGNTTGFCVHMDGKRANAFCNIFADDETLESFDTLVVNSGAHAMYDYDEYEMSMEMSGRILSEKMRRLHGNRAVYIARNTPPGHWECDSHTYLGPVKPNVAQHLVDESPHKYNWEQFEELNVAFEKGFSKEMGWWMIDAFTPTFMRADSHIGDGDCLHYCVPGPADHWVDLFYNILLRAV